MHFDTTIRKFCHKKCKFVKILKLILKIENSSIREFLSVKHIFELFALCRRKELSPHYSMTYVVTQNTQCTKPMGYAAKMCRNCQMCGEEKVIPYWVGCRSSIVALAHLISLSSGGRILTFENQITGSERVNWSRSWENRGSPKT